MRSLYKKVLIFFLAVATIFLVGSKPVYAADLDESIVRLERTQVSQPSYPILVVIEPSTLTTSRTETTFRFTFASGFTVNSTASNIQTSTSGLPSSIQGNTITAMPGLSATATSVSGQQVNFSISDLTDGTRYGFFITSGITNPSAATSYSYVISTRDGSGEIDRSPVGSGVDISNDQVNVSASIPVKSGDGELNITGDPVTGSTIQDGDVVTGTISYRSTASTNKSFQIIASWEKGTIVNSSNQVDVFDYVVGSASNAYNDTQPVIDVQNRTITWTIVSMPPTSASQTVTFKLRVRSDLPQNADLSAHVYADGTIGTSALPRRTLSYNIRLRTPVHPTATPGPGTITPIPSLEKFDFEYIRLLRVTNADALVSIRATQDAQVELVYGLSPSNLNKRLQSLTYERTTLIEIPNLLPNTRYYFKVTIKNKAGETRTSDTLTFKTSVSSATIHVSRVEIFWKQLLLSMSSSVEEIGNIAHALMPRKKNFTIKIHVDNPADVKEMYVKIVKKGVLGINSFERPANEIETRMVESLPQQFIGELQAPADLGEYQLILTVHDVFGGFYTDILKNEVHVMNPITVVNTLDSKPVESAKVILSKFSDVNKTYTPLRESISFVDVTDEHGELNLALVKGKYKVEVTSIGHKPLTQEFQLDESHPYPVIKMQSNVTIQGMIDYARSSLKQLHTFIARHLFDIATSAYGRAGLLIIATLLTLVLAVITWLTKLKLSKKFHDQKHQKLIHHHIHHEQLMELLIITAYVLFCIAIIPTIFMFGIISYYVGVGEAFAFAILAVLDIMLLYIYVRWMAGFIYLK